MQQLDPELEALCDFTLILVPTNALPQEQQPAHEAVSAPAAGNSREQQPLEPSSTAPEQAPQPCEERQAAGTSRGSRASKRKLQGETSQAAGVHSKRSQQRARRLPQDKNVCLDEFLKEVRTIINRKLWGRKEMSEFKEPVDPVKLSYIPDYYTIIKHPMDVGTVRKKLDTRQYSSPLEVRDDLRLVWRNCATYFPPGHVVRTAGDVLANVFEAAWAESKIEERWNEYLDRMQHDPKAPQPCGGEQAAGTSGGNAETQQPQPATTSAATSNSQAAPPVSTQTGAGGVTGQQPSEERAADGAEGSQARKRKLQGEPSQAAGAQSEEVSDSKCPRTECDPEQAALLPGAVVVPASRYSLALHSLVLRPILAERKEQKTMVLPCEHGAEDVEAGKLIVLMILRAHPSSMKELSASLASSTSVSTLIRCVHFAVYLDAQVPLELAIDSLCLIPPEQLTVRDINTLLALPGAVQVIPALFDKVKGLCSRWLQHAFGDAARLLGSEQLKAELCSLEQPAIQLFSECMSPKLCREEVVHALVLWCCHPSRCASLGGEAFRLLGPKDTGTMLSLPAESGARGLCIKWLLHFYEDMHEVVEQQDNLSAFSMLPFAAVCLWAEQDGLIVRHSENEVAVALELYAKAAKLSAAQCKQLGSLLHVSSMSYSFRHFILPKLSLMSAFKEILTTFNAELDVGATEGLSACSVFPSAWVGSRVFLEGQNPI